MTSVFSGPAGRGLFWACLLAIASPAQATLIASSSVSYDEGFFNGTTTLYGPTVVGGGPSTIGYNSLLVPGLATSGYGDASYGALHASAVSVAANPGVGATSQARAVGSAFFSDQLTFSSASLTGAAFARASFAVSGSLNSLSEPATVGNATIAALVKAGGTTVFTSTGQLVSQGGTITVNDARRGQAVNGVMQIESVSGVTGLFSFDIPFQFGVGFQLTASLDAFTQALSAVAGRTGSAYSDFGSTATWKGISEVHLADGTVLKDFSLASASGTNWINAFPAGPVTDVPIPATLWLFGVGLLGWIGAGRRGKR